MLTENLPETGGATSVARRSTRLGVVSFVNTLPLIDGLDQLADVELRPSVPSALIDRLLADEVDVALCSSIDYQRSPEPLVILPAGILGCDGPTLTVRLYSMKPLEEVERVYCDSDSHTSTVLLQILFREMHHRTLELVEYDAREHHSSHHVRGEGSSHHVRGEGSSHHVRGEGSSHHVRGDGAERPEAMLLIGDKVVIDSPPAVRYPHQLDLGAAWRDLTGLPFVFATWLAKRTADPDRLRTAVALLDRQRRRNRDLIPTMIHRAAVPRGWPRDLAEGYLRTKLVYDFTERSLSALDTFFDMALRHELIAARKITRVWGQS